MARICSVGDYLLRTTLGTGTTGKVKLAQHRITGKQVAIKIIRKQYLRDRPDLNEKVHREIALMRVLDHPNVNALIEVLESCQHMYVVSEFAEHGELFEYCSERGALPIEEAMGFFRQLIYGLEFMHSIGVAHRDIKPENLLLDINNNIKIADLGFSRWMTDGTAETSCGSPHYAAPEILAGGTYSGRAADIWSAGVVLFVLVTGRLPFDDSSIRGLIQKIQAGKFRAPGSLDEEMVSFIRGMIEVDVNQRASIEAIKGHPVFRRGLAPTYVLPKPLPIPQLAEPMDPAGEELQEILHLLGLNPEALLEPGFAPEKLFAFIVGTRKRDRFGYLPWERANLEVPADGEEAVPLVEWRMDLAGNLGRSISLTLPSGSMSVVERVRFAAQVMGLPDAEEAPLVFSLDVRNHLDVVVAATQAWLTREEFRWFHPDPMTLLARSLDDMIDLYIEFEPNEDMLVVRAFQRGALDAGLVLLGLMQQLGGQELPLDYMPPVGQGPSY